MKSGTGAVRRVVGVATTAAAASSVGLVAGAIVGCVAGWGLGGGSGFFVTSRISHFTAEPRPATSAPRLASERVASGDIFAASVHFWAVFVSHLLAGKNARRNALTCDDSRMMNTR